jgi:hypothetical protein
MESEYIALSTCVDELVTTTTLLRSMSVPLSTSVSCSHSDAVSTLHEAVRVHGDNKASICVGNGTASGKRSRHINIKFHNVKDAVREGVVSLHYVPSHLNIADIFTKCLGSVAFGTLRNSFMG